MKKCVRFLSLILLNKYIGTPATANCSLFSLACFNWEFTITATESCRFANYEGLDLLELVNNGDTTSDCGFQDWCNINIYILYYHVKRDLLR